MRAGFPPTLAFVLAACGRPTVAVGGDASGSIDSQPRDSPAVPDTALADGRGPDAHPGDASLGDASLGDAGTTGPALCAEHHWSAPLTVTGSQLMAFQGRAYLFAPDGHTWTVIENGIATGTAIPFPAGVTSIQAVSAELAPNGRPVLAYRSDGDNSTQHATFFDGSQFTTPITTAPYATVHADGAGRIYAVGSTGLVEHPPGAAAIVRGALPHTPGAWTVASNGTVYLLHVTTMMVGTSITHRLELMSLPHGSPTWSESTVIASNLDLGFTGLKLAAAADGSLHVAYERTTGYLRSHDGTTWEQAPFSEFAPVATMIDPATTNNTSFDPRILAGAPDLLVALDFDHVALTTITQYGSTFPSSVYVARRCSPFVGPSHTQWPADRFTYGYAPAISAVDERGLATVVTPSGVRQALVGP